MKDIAVDPAERWLCSVTDIIRNNRRTRTRLTPAGTSGDTDAGYSHVTKYRPTFG
jgi:hypothetical protein